MRKVQMFDFWCPGQIEAQPDADGSFSNAPIFNWSDGKVKFNANDLDNPNANYGAMSGFVPKFLHKSECSLFVGILAISLI
mgnify:CR=1 FL=1